MFVERHFLGWDAPLTQKLPEFLLPSGDSGPVELGKDLIVVPTRQAGRRLREALALRCAQRATALLSPQVVVPNYFLYPESESATVANQTEVAAVWANVLMQIDINDYRALFPVQTPERDFDWVMHTGEMIQQLRDTLADGGYRIVDVYRDFGDILEELDRWQDLANLERVYLARV